MPRHFTNPAGNLSAKPEPWFKLLLFSSFVMADLSFDAVAVSEQMRCMRAVGCGLSFTGLQKELVCALRCYRFPVSFRYSSMHNDNGMTIATSLRY